MLAEIAPPEEAVLFENKHRVATGCPFPMFLMAPPCEARGVYGDRFVQGKLATGQGNCLAGELWVD